MYMYTYIYIYIYIWFRVYPMAERANRDAVERRHVVHSLLLV